MLDRKLYPPLFLVVAYEHSNNLYPTFPYYIYPINNTDLTKRLLINPSCKSIKSLISYGNYSGSLEEKLNSLEVSLLSLFSCFGVILDSDSLNQNLLENFHDTLYSPGFLSEHNFFIVDIKDGFTYRLIGGINSYMNKFLTSFYSRTKPKLYTSLVSYLETEDWWKKLAIVIYNQVLRKIKTTIFNKISSNSLHQFDFRLNHRFKREVHRILMYMFNNPEVELFIEDSGHEIDVKKFDSRLYLSLVHKDVIEDKI